METVSDFIFWGFKITTDGDCSYGIKRHLLLGRIIMTKIDSILKSRDITLPTKVHLVKAMVFPVVMYGCESWTVKKAERWKTDAFELWCWRRLLRVPWTARKSNQSILKGWTLLRCTQLWNSLISCYFVPRHLPWVVDVFLLIDGERQKEPFISHAIEDKILYVIKPKISTKIILELLNKFRKDAR